MPSVQPSEVDFFDYKGWKTCQDFRGKQKNWDCIDQIHLCKIWWDFLINNNIFLNICLKDIKATHVAIEAPFQVLLKLSMISIGILNAPGKMLIAYNNASYYNIYIFF